MEILFAVYTYLCVGIVTGVILGLFIFGGKLSFKLNVRESIEALKSIWRHLF